MRKNKWLDAMPTVVFHAHRLIGGVDINQCFSGRILLRIWREIEVIIIMDWLPLLNSLFFSCRCVIPTQLLCIPLKALSHNSFDLFSSARAAGTSSSPLHSPSIVKKFNTSLPGFYARHISIIRKIARTAYAARKTPQWPRDTYYVRECKCPKLRATKRYSCTVRACMHVQHWLINTEVNICVLYYLRMVHDGREENGKVGGRPRIPANPLRKPVFVTYYFDLWL
jgi:hypothetical protein